MLKIVLLNYFIQIKIISKYIDDLKNIFNYYYIMLKLLSELTHLVDDNKKIFEIENCRYKNYYNDDNIILSTFLLHIHTLNIYDTTYIVNYAWSNLINNYIKKNDIMTDNYKRLAYQNNSNLNLINYENAFILHHMYDNTGHAFSNIMYGIYLYFINNLNCDIIVTDRLLKLGTFIESLIYLFFPKNKIKVVTNKDIIHINKCFMYHGIDWYFFQTNCILNKSITHKIVEFINLQTTSLKKCDIHINFLLNKLDKINKLEYLNKISYENVCILKTTKTKNNSENRSFNDSYITFFQSNKYNIVIPEEFSIVDLYYILNNAKNLIISWGCNAFMNKIYINQNANTIILAHNGYKHEYWTMGEQLTNNNICSGFVPNCKKTILLYDLDTEMSSDTKLLLQNIILKIN